MDRYLDIVLTNLRNLTWEGPTAFVVAIIAIFALFRKWSLALLIILIVVIGWGAQDMIVMNLDTRDTVISVPLLIYGVGGVMVFILALFSFFKSN